MKNVLLGTTALVALGLAPALAEAADKIELGLGGYYRFYAVAADLDDGADATSPTGQDLGAGLREHGVGREGEVHFRGQTTLDNGIKVGVRVELEAETSLDQIDNSFIWFDGGFGRVEMGSTWGPGVIMFYGSPGNVIPGHGNFASQVHAPSMGGGLGYFSSYNFRLDGVNDKVVYYSPRFAGFQVGLGYTPDNKAGIGGIEESGGGINPDGGNTAGVYITPGAGASEIFTIGANYVNKFSNVDVALYGSYSDTDNEVTNADDPNSWNLGGRIGYMGFSIGGSYLDIESAGVAGAIALVGTPVLPAAAFTAANGIDRQEWEIGAAYSTGPWTFGLVYHHLEQDSGVATIDDHEGDYYSLGVTYALGPGVLLVGGVQHYDYDSGTTPGGAKVFADGESTLLLIGTSLSF